MSPKTLKILAISLSAVLLLGAGVFAYFNRGVFQGMFGKANVRQYGEYCDAPENRFAWQDFQNAYNDGWVQARITVDSASRRATATIDNRTFCQGPVSLYSYKMFDRKLSTQQLFKKTTTRTIQANGKTTLSVDLPDCMAQVDLYFGSGTDHPETMTEGDGLITWAYHLNTGGEYTSAQGPFCGQAPTETDHDPIGNFDTANCTTIAGWALDSDVPSQTLEVHLYRDGAAGQGGVFLTSVTANKPRADVNQSTGVSGNHGFEIAVPANLQDGTSHSLYAYAINPVSGKVNPLLSASPKTILCGAPASTVVCAPTAQTVSVGTPASLVASGGNGTYAWSAQGGSPASGAGANFSTTYTSTGSKTVSVSSNGKQASCQVTVQSVPVVKQCKLEISKSVDKQTAKAGDRLTYTITLKNTGGADCTGGGVHVEDKYDAALKFISETHSGDIVRGYSDTGAPFNNPATSTLSWNANVLSPGETNTITWVAEVKPVAACTIVNVKNKARVTADQYDNMTRWVESNEVVTGAGETCQNPPPPTPTPPPTPVTVDVGVQKSVSPSLITIGQTATFTVTVKNNGPVVAQGVQVKDIVPTAGLTLQSATPSVGTYTQATGIWLVGDMQVNATATIQFVVRGDAVGAKVNTATVVAVTPNDSNSANNQASATLTVTAPETPNVVCAPSTQSVQVNATANFAVVGGTGTYAWSAPSGSPESGSGSSFSTRYSEVGNKTVTVTSGTKQATCQVSVTAPPPPPAPQLDLAVTKQVNPSLVVVGQTADFTMTVTNRTSVIATGVVYSDTLPSGLQYVSATASQGVYDQTTGRWDVGTLNAGATATLTIRISTSSVGSYTNRIDLLTSTPQDTDSSNNTASATLVVQAPTGGGNPPVVCTTTTNTVQVGQQVSFTASGGNGVYSWSAQTGSPTSGSGNAFIATFGSAGAHTVTVLSAGTSASCTVNAYLPQPLQIDLSLTKTVTPTTILVGGEAVFAITARNSGPAIADSVTVRDVLPAGLEFVRAAATRGIYDAGSGIWSIGQLQVGEEVTLLVTVKSLAIGTHANTAEVWTANTTDIDSTPGNGVSGEDDIATVSLTVGKALPSAGIPLGPIIGFALLCFGVAVAALRIRKSPVSLLNTPLGSVELRWY